MIRALSTAATGLEAQSANIDRVSNDLANVNTDGYKRQRSEFKELMYETTREPGSVVGTGASTPVGIQTGMGVKVGASYKMHEPGPARMTYHPFDFMIEGKGFFPVQMPNGEVGYARAGAFHPDAQGRLTLSSGAALIPQVQIPSTSTNIVVTPSGEIKAHFQNGTESTIGQMQLVVFQNEQGLTGSGEGVYKPTAASGPPVQGIPGENGIGTIQQGAIEGSNVNVANSMVEMIQTQRAFDMNTKVMKSVDEMLKATVDLK